MPTPTLPDVKTYLKDSASAYTDAVLTDALEAEQAAQKRLCRVDVDNYPADLRQALLRRVARNLAMRNIPLGVQMDDVGGMRVGSTDPEVRRLEAPHRKIVVG